VALAHVGVTPSGLLTLSFMFNILGCDDVLEVTRVQKLVPAVTLLFAFGRSPVRISVGSIKLFALFQFLQALY
jgi:hypothetical protein